MNKTAALLFGKDTHHVDHLAPFCSLFELPLFFTDETLFHLARNQYENLTAYLEPSTSVCMSIAKHFDQLITTLPKALVAPLFLVEQTVLQKKLATFWLPHGASDKKNLAALEEEDHLLVYGEKMKRLLPEKVQHKTTLIGNFRYRYFLQHAPFYETLLQNTFIFGKENYLFAPSWEEKEIPFWVESLIERKPEHVHLFLKLHPNTTISEVLQEKYRAHKKVTFMDTFTPIYPLLSKMDRLFTDISSIGYDFLTFDRPIHFTTTKQEDLQQAGELALLESPYKFSTKDFSAQRKALYAQTFLATCKTDLQFF